MWDQNPSSRFEIDNFSDKEAAIASRVFVAGGCEWYLAVHPRRHNDHLSLYLYVANRESLRTGWKRSAKYYFRVLKESNKELYKSSIFGTKESEGFCARSPGWGVSKTLPLSKFQESGFLENDKLIIEVYIKVVEAFDGEGGDINGFQVFAAHVASVKKTFVEHVAKTEYKNTLSNACSKLSELAEVGVKLDWLKSKFDEVSFKWKNADGAADESLVQQLEERIKNLELMESGFKKDFLNSKSKWKKSHAADECRFQTLEESVKNLELMELGLKLDSLKSKLEEVSSENKKSHDADESRAQILEGRLKKIELMKTGSKLKSLKLKLEEIALEKKKSYDATESRVQQLEERIKNIELMDIGLKLDCMNTKLDNSDESLVQQLDERVKDMSRKVGFKLDCLNTTIEERSLERTKSDDSRFQKLEESVNNIAVMVSCLKVELDKKKDKPTAEGFLLVD